MSHELVEKKDIESFAGKGKERSFSVQEIQAEEVKLAREIQSSYRILESLKQSEVWLDTKLGGVETQGIDRVLEEQKQPPSLLNTFFLWFSLNIHVGVLPLGVLGAEFGLSFKQNLAASIVGIGLGALCTAFTCTLSPKLGLRQIATSRYSFGFYGTKLCSVLNIIVGGGYGVVNYVVVGQILNAASNFRISITVGIIIIAILSYIISVFGFRIIHTFEKYSWISTLILLLVLLGQISKHAGTDTPGEDGNSGVAYAGAFLSILAINFSNSSGWCSIAGDYYVHYPANTNSWILFATTWSGITIANSFSVIVGALLGQAALITKYEPFYEAYTNKNHGLGGLISAAYHPDGWSKFCLVLLTFSVLGNNVAINYSSGLSLQLLGHHFHAIPRYIWSLLFIMVVAVLAIAGQQHLSTIVTNFVSLLGYWTVSFTIILLLEDKWFRRRIGYDLSVWDTPNKLPLGVSAIMALLSGYLAGGVPGMAQTWYIGAIAKHFGRGGGDVGIYLSGVITLIVYPILRTIELKKTGK